MKAEYVKAITTLWEKELGAKKVSLNSKISTDDKIECYKLGDTYIRLDSFAAVDSGRIYCIEAATLAEAQNNVFDDAWTYWDGNGLDKIIAQMRKNLKSIV